MAARTPPNAATASPRNNQDPRGARRRRGTGSNFQFHYDSASRGLGFRGSGDRGARGRGRGGQSSHQRFSPSQDGPHPKLFPHNSSFGGHVPRDTTSGPAETNGTPDAAPEEAIADEAERELCFICASTIEHTSIAPCNHQTCHVCALRWRALYKTRACAHCRVCEPPKSTQAIVANTSTPDRCAFRDFYRYFS